MVNFHHRQVGIGTRSRLGRAWDGQVSRKIRSVTPHCHNSAQLRSMHFRRRCGVLARIFRPSSLRSLTSDSLSLMLRAKGTGVL